MKSRHLEFATAFVLALGISAPAFAGPNDFFGGTIPGGDPNAPPPGAAAAAQQVQAGAAEFTDDEKRMRKKYRANIDSAQKLVAKADKMIKYGQAKKDDKAYKKGKILKDIGERRLAELRANSPFPEMAAKVGAGTQ